MAEQTASGDPLGLVAQLVALAGDQAETRRRVGQLTAAVEDVGGQLTELAGSGAAAEEQLSAVCTAVEELTAAVERLSVEPDRLAVWTWVGMDTNTPRPPTPTRSRPGLRDVPHHPRLTVVVRARTG